RKPGLYRRVGLACGIDVLDATAEDADHRTIDFVRELVGELGLAEGLRAHGAKESQLDALTTQAYADSCHATNPVPVTRDDLKARKRTDLLFALAALIRKTSETLAQLECRNIGKPISDARDEVELGARVFEYYAGAIGKFFGQTIPVGRGGFDFTLRQPMGVI